MDGIKLGVEYLYSLRYVYNNLNLSNIMVGKDNTPIIINLGFCKRFSRALISRGIYRQIDEDFITSKQRYNKAALIKLQEWLKKK